MMIYGCLMCCCDPILSIAAALQCQSPFYGPKAIRDKVDETRRKMSDGIDTQSDHITTLLAYNGWQDAKKEKKHKEYLRNKFLSHTTLTQIMSIKRQFAEVLSDLGFIRRGVSSRRMRGLPGDGVREASGLELNTNSDNIKLVEAVLLAGLYPNVAFVKPPRKGDKGGGDLCLFTKRDGPVSIHPSSVLFELKLKDYATSQCLVYHNKVKVRGTIRCLCVWYAE
jgi:ATP-dependent RNA helicase DHX57